jgi:hypothetical protein
MARKGLTEFCTKPECFMKLCRCPMSPEQVIESRLICLSETMWNEEELQGFRKELLQLTNNKNFISLVQHSLDDLGPREKQRLVKQLQLLGEKK